VKNNYWLTSGFYSLLNQLTMLFFNLGTVFILWRVLDKPTCSIWVIFLLITSFIEVGRTGLLQNGLMTYLSSNALSEHGKINTASLFLNLTLSVIFAIFLLLSSKWLALISPNHAETNAQITALLNIYAGTTLILSGLYQFNFIQQLN
jgi:lipopolysaccharide exporter